VIKLNKALCKTWALEDILKERDDYIMKNRKLTFLSLLAAILFISILVTGCSNGKAVKTQSQSKTNKTAVTADSSESSANSNSSASTPSTAMESSSTAVSPSPTTYTPFGNPRFGFWVDYPSDLITKTAPDNGDGQTFESKDGSVVFSAYGSNNADSFTVAEYLKQIVLPNFKNVTYQAQGSNWDIVSWTDGNTIGYEKDIVGSGSIDTFYIKYPASSKAEFDPIIAHISQSFNTPGIDTSH
jgi:hypothetical protein